MDPDDPAQLNDQELIAYWRLYSEKRFDGCDVAAETRKRLRGELDRREIVVLNVVPFSPLIRSQQVKR